MSATNKGADWEFRHSLWVIWGFFGLAFIAFLIIANGAKKRQWFIYAAVYAALFALWLAFTEAGEESALYDVGTTIGAFNLIGGTIHLFLVRKEYLRRRVIIAEEGYQVDEMELERQRMHRERGMADTVEQAQEKLRRRIEERQAATQQEPVQRPQQPATPKPAAPKVPVEPIDINTCSITQLADLPGVTLVMAKKADDIRRERGGFKSVEEFFEAIQLKPHFVMQVQDKVTCAAPQPEAPTVTDEPVGRKLDF